MHPIVEAKLPEIAELCRRHHVKRLELFGSAATGKFDPKRSDFDFLVEFLPDAPRRAFAGYFDLKEDLEALFGRSVDLVDISAIRNPYFRQAINQGRRVLLYAA